MRVLFLTRANLLESRAGDTIQVLKTQEYLQRMGVDVELSPWKVDLSDYDIVHLFNSNNINELRSQFLNCKKQGKKTALSTIYWDMTEYITKDRHTSTTLDWWRAVSASKKDILENVDILLPNSEGEYRHLASEMLVENKYHVVPNGVDKLFLQGRPGDFTAKYKVYDYVLCVGRIAHRKNQLTLIKALKGTGIPVVFIGSQNNPAYFKLCQAEADPNFRFINEIPHAALPSAYAAARVHVLPSWFETPGLVNLEAALSNCPVITTPLGTTREYFGDLVTYCSPDREDSIREAVLGSLKKRPDGRLRQHVFQNYTWEKAAEETLRAYELVV